MWCCLIYQVDLLKVVSSLLPELKPLLSRTAKWWDIMTSKFPANLMVHLLELDKIGTMKIPMYKVTKEQSEALWSTYHMVGRYLK